MMNYYFEKMIQKHFEENDPNSMATRWIISQVKGRRKVWPGSALFAALARKPKVPMQQPVTEVCC